jgi:hypothetical protein
MYFRTGSVYTFIYNHPVKDAGSGGRNKEVLILHPHWNNRVHALDLGRLNPAEREVLQAILEPYDPNIPHRLPLVNSIRSRLDARKLILTPKSFYDNFLKLFLRGKDAYRQYDRNLMSGLKLVKNRDLTGKTLVKNPLFKKPNPGDPKTPESPKPPKPGSPAEKIAKKIQAMRAKSGAVNTGSTMSALKSLPQGVTQTGVLGTGPAAKLAAMRAKLKQKK